MNLTETMVEPGLCHTGSATPSPLQIFIQEFFNLGVVDVLANQVLIKQPFQDRQALFQRTVPQGLVQ